MPVTAADGALRDSSAPRPRHSAAMKLTGKIPATRTRLTAGYKWVNGLALSRVDPYGEAIYDMNPYLQIGIQQPLPWSVWALGSKCGVR